MARRAAVAHRMALSRAITCDSWRAPLLVPSSSAAERAAESAVGAVRRRSGKRRASRRLDAPIATPARENVARTPPALAFPSEPSDVTRAPVSDMDTVNTAEVSYHVPLFTTLGPVIHTSGLELKIERRTSNFLSVVEPAAKT